MNERHIDTDPQETQEWIESIEDALEEHGYERTRFLLETLIDYAQSKGARLPFEFIKDEDADGSDPFVDTAAKGQGRMGRGREERVGPQHYQPFAAGHARSSGGRQSSRKASVECGHEWRRWRYWRRQPAPSQAAHHSWRDRFQ